MGWLLKTLLSSIGKKWMMAATGLAFCGFLTVHLIGNLTIFGGHELFDAYAEHLHSLGPLVTVFELGLLLLALVHVCTGLTLFVQNLRARPVRYAVNRRAGGRSWGSATMPYTGIWVLAFVAVHLVNFHFVDKGERTIAVIVSQAFTDPLYVALYVISMVAVALHVSHGFWSAFQTFGVSHPRYSPLIHGVGSVFSVAVGVGFGAIPLFLLLTP